MAIQVQGSGGVVADVGGTTLRGLKTQAMPYEYGVLGHYRVSTPAITSPCTSRSNRSLTKNFGR